MFGLFVYYELLERFFYVAVAYRRDDDAWRVVGLYVVCECVEGYGCNMDGVVFLFDCDEVDVDVVVLCDMEMEVWFDVVTFVIDVEGEV